MQVIKKSELNTTPFAFTPVGERYNIPAPLVILLFAEDLGQHALHTHCPVRQYQLEGALEFAGIEP
ncbi:hypothetical protein D3C79_601500 [compost metagenome]